MNGQIVMWVWSGCVVCQSMQVSRAWGANVSRYVSEVTASGRSRNGSGTTLCSAAAVQNPSERWWIADMRADAAVDEGSGGQPTRQHARQNH
jgi:hypothetical protein